MQIPLKLVTYGNNQGYNGKIKFLKYYTTVKSV